MCESFYTIEDARVHYLKSKAKYLKQRAQKFNGLLKDCLLKWSELFLADIQLRRL